MRPTHLFFFYEFFLPTQLLRPTLILGTPEYIAVTSSASKLQIFKVRPGRDLNPDLPRESLNIGILTHVGGSGSNSCQAKL